MILVIGANGQLGHDVLENLKMRKIKCIGFGKKDLDITKKDDVLKKIGDLKPTAIINCAAFTKVDNAELDKDMCFNVNVSGTDNIIEASKKFNSKLMIISTDYVFDGEKVGEYEVDDSKNPISYYGYTKSLSEDNLVKNMQEYFIIRTSWLFGMHGNNFVNSIISLSRGRNNIRVVDDQIGSPTYSYDLSEKICDIIETNKYGIYNITNEGFCSWKEFAEEIITFLNIECKVVGITSEEYGSVAKRPKNSRLSKRKLIENSFSKLPHWKCSLHKYLEELIKQEGVFNDNKKDNFI